MNGRLHFCGIAGTGMSAVAEAAVCCGRIVSGSDRSVDSGNQPPIIARLQSRGIRIFPQDGSGIAADCAALIVSTAIESDNPDLLAAQQKKIPVLHRAEFLAQLMGASPCAAVTGTSGKSTVTGMTGCIMECAGADPFVVNGAPVINWQTDKAGGAVRAGLGPIWIFEADESDRSLLVFNPHWAAVTNVSEDHFSRSEAENLFATFINRVRHGVVLPSDKENTCESERLNSWEPSFCWQNLQLRLRVPGLHNIQNAVTAARLARMMGAGDDAIRQGLLSFRGISRRLEMVGCRNDIQVVDDFAHNPAKIAASLSTMRAVAAGRVMVVWRPHGYGPLRSMLNPLAEVFSAGMRPDDRLILLPVYDAGGTADRSVNSAALAECIAQKGGTAQVVDNTKIAADLLLRHCHPGDMIITMGARDPGLPELARAILRRI